MPTATDIFIERHTTYRDVIEDSEAIRMLSVAHGLSYDGARGTYSKANNNPACHLALSDYLANDYVPDESVTKQEDIIKDSTDIFNALQAQDKPEHTAVFISDKHNPDYRRDAWELTSRILEDMPPVDFITVQNDWNSNTGWGQWADTRRPLDSLWTGDIQNTRRLESADYKLLKLVQPEASLIAVMGNHDRWWYTHKRATSPQDAEKQIHDYMSWLSNEFGILQFTRGYHENAVRLSPGLVFVHGKWSSKSPMANAKNAVKQFTVKGQSSSVVFGHSHRVSVTEGHSIGIPGVTVVNNGCMCSSEESYLPYGKSNTWGMSITVAHYNPRKYEHDLEVIRFTPKGNKLVARYNGKRYETELKE